MWGPKWAKFFDNLLQTCVKFSIEDIHNLWLKDDLIEGYPFLSPEQGSEKEDTLDHAYTFDPNDPNFFYVVWRWSRRRHKRRLRTDTIDFSGHNKTQST